MGTSAAQILVSMVDIVKMELVPTLAHAWMVIKARTVNLVGFCCRELWQWSSQEVPEMLRATSFLTSVICLLEKCVEEDGIQQWVGGQCQTHKALESLQLGGVREGSEVMFAPKKAFWIMTMPLYMSSNPQNMMMKPSSIGFLQLVPRSLYSRLRSTASLLSSQQWRTKDNRFQ